MAQAFENENFQTLSPLQPFLLILWGGIHGTHLTYCNLKVRFSIPSRFTIESSARGHFFVPRTRTSMRVIDVLEVLILYMGPIKWNKLSQSLRDLLPISSDQFRKHLKTSQKLSH